MPARLAYRFFYRTITRNMDEDQRLEIDEILGDTSAEQRREEHRRAAVAASGFEVG